MSLSSLIRLMEKRISSFINFQLDNLLIYKRLKTSLDRDRRFANWLITTFANLRWWPFVFYKFLVYLFIC